MQRNATGPSHPSAFLIILVIATLFTVWLQRYTLRKTHKKNNLKLQRHLSWSFFAPKKSELDELSVCVCERDFLKWSVWLVCNYPVSFFSFLSFLRCCVWIIYNWIHSVILLDFLISGLSSILICYQLLTWWPFYCDCVCVAPVLSMILRMDDDCKRLHPKNLVAVWDEAR